MLNQNIGGLATMVNALRPVMSAAAASYSLAGVAIDREKHASALFCVSTGAATGTPDAVAVDAKLQESDASGSGYTDVVASPQNPSVAVPQVAAVNTQKFLEVDLSGLKRYVRLVFTVAFTGGTTPTVALDAKAVLGGGPILPQTHA